MGKIAQLQVICPHCNKATNIFITESENYKTTVKCQNCKKDFEFSSGMMYKPVGYVSEIPAWAVVKTLPDCDICYKQYKHGFVTIWKETNGDHLLIHTCRKCAIEISQFDDCGGDMKGPFILFGIDLTLIIIGLVLFFTGSNTTAIDWGKILSIAGGLIMVMYILPYSNVLQFMTLLAGVTMPKKWIMEGIFFAAQDKAKSGKVDFVKCKGE